MKQRQIGMVNVSLSRWQEVGLSVKSAGKVETAKRRTVRTPCQEADDEDREVAR